MKKEREKEKLRKEDAVGNLNEALEREVRSRRNTAVGR